MEKLISRVKKSFEIKFNRQPLLIASPGRINLIGEHTDYNEGFVLPGATDRVIILGIAPRSDRRCRFYSLDFDQYFETDLDHLHHSPLRWPDYLQGVLDQFLQAGYKIQGVELAFGGNVPIGGGMSSSAAVEGGMAFALNYLFGLNLDLLTLTRLAQKAENEFVGIKCGIMDMFANLHGQPRKVLKIDCRSLEFEYYPFEREDISVVISDTLVRRELASSEYNVRRQQCEEGVRLLQKYYSNLKSLRDVNLKMLEEHKEWKPNVYGQCKSWLDLGLQPRAVSRDLDWGIPVPVEGARGKVLYVWFDAPIGYISATKDLTPDWEKYWKNPETRLIHFIGKDNIVFHCIIFPAMLKAEGSFILPDNVPANEFLNLEGDKISTSRNWAVWLHEYLEEFPGKEDVLRYTLCANAPETKDNDFTWKDFQARNNNELVAILGNFVNRTLVLTEKYFKGAVPPVIALETADREVFDQMPVIRKNLEENLENFRFRDALKEAMNLARLGNKYLADTEPWIKIKTDPDRVSTILNVSLQITANLSILLEPFLPFTTEKLRKFLNVPTFEWDLLGRSDLLQPGHHIGKSALLFEKIDDEAITRQLDKLAAAKKANEAAATGIKPAKASVSYDDFAKMDIRIGTVLHAEPVPKTDKLLKLLVDTGIDKRTIVSGIAAWFKPEDIIGKQVTVLANLEPRTIRGITSQGMILLAEEPDGRLVLVTPEKQVLNGSDVK